MRNRDLLFLNLVIASFLGGVRSSSAFTVSFLILRLCLESIAYGLGTGSKVTTSGPVHADHRSTSCRDGCIGRSDLVIETANLGFYKEAFRGGVVCLDCVMYGAMCLLHVDHQGASLSKTVAELGAIET
ncbi:hypothetical protein VTN02DRAFT_4509 [Thermoascus thermophilus]